VRLRAILAELHVYAGRTDWKQPLRLGLDLEGRPFLRIRERRGDGIGFDALPLEPANLGEGGRIEVHDVTARLSPGLAGSEIEALRAIEDGSGHAIGLAIVRGRKPAFCIWIDGDEFRWGSEAAMRSAPFEEGVWPTLGREL